MRVSDETESTEAVPELARPRGLRLWLWVVAISVLSAFVVPYFVLPLFADPLATYFFWTGFSLAIAVFIFWGVARWRDQ